MQNPERRRCDTSLTGTCRRIGESRVIPNAGPRFFFPAALWRARDAARPARRREAGLPQAGICFCRPPVATTAHPSPQIRLARRLRRLQRKRLANSRRPPLHPKSRTPPQENPLRCRIPNPTEKTQHPLQPKIRRSLTNARAAPTALPNPLCGLQFPLH
jgi:hypothetical protein